MNRKFSMVKYGCRLLRVPLRGTLGRGARNGSCCVCVCVYSEYVIVRVSVGQGDASCGSSLNILAGNISDAFPSLFHHSLPSCFPFSASFSASFSFFPLSVMKRGREKSTKTVVTDSAVSTNTWFSCSLQMRSGRRQLGRAERGTHTHMNSLLVNIMETKST